MTFHSFRVVVYLKLILRALFAKWFGGSGNCMFGAAETLQTYPPGKGHGKIKSSTVKSPTHVKKKHSAPQMYSFFFRDPMKMNGPSWILVCHPIVKSRDPDCVLGLRRAGIVLQAVARQLVMWKRQKKPSRIPPE